MIIDDHSEKKAAIQPSETEENVWFVHLFEGYDLVETQRFTDVDIAHNTAVLWVTPEDYEDMH